jgi:hypothetical protein
MLVGCLVGATFSALVDDIKLANAARKGVQSDIGFAKYGEDILGGCVVGAVISGLTAMVGVVGGWALGGLAEAVLPNTAGLLMPGGSLIGIPGESLGVRVATGGALAAGRLFTQLTRGATQVTATTYKGVLMQLPKGGTVGLRLSTKYGPTIDINLEDFPLLEKIHFRP